MQETEIGEQVEVLKGPIPNPGKGGLGRNLEEV